MLDTKTKRARLVVMLLVGIFAAFCLGCGQCESDYDCDGLRVCNVERGTCTDLECRRDRDCPPAQRCRTNRCVPADESIPHGDEAAVSLPMEIEVDLNGEPRDGDVVDEN